MYELSIKYVCLAFLQLLTGSGMSVENWWPFAYKMLLLLLYISKWRHSFYNHRNTQSDQTKKYWRYQFKLNRGNTTHCSKFSKFNTWIWAKMMNFGVPKAHNYKLFNATRTTVKYLEHIVCDVKCSHWVSIKNGWQASELRGSWCLWGRNIHPNLALRII